MIPYEIPISIICIIPYEISRLLVLGFSLHFFASASFGFESMSWSAETLEQKYGSLLREPPYSDAGSPRQLFRMLEQQKPRDKISEGVCKSWFGKYRVARESSANTAQ